MAKKSVKKQFLNGYERILKIDYMISHMHYPNVEDFARETEASIPTINRDLRDLRLKFGAEDILQYDRMQKGFYYTRPSFASLSDNIDEDSKLKSKKLSNRILFLGMDPVKIDDEVWEKLESAMAGNNYVRFRYRGYDTDFVVQPWQLIYSQGMWSLYAYNQRQEVKEVRFYNLPDIHNLEVDQRTFELPKDFEYTKRAKGNFRRYIGKETLRCKIKVTSQKTLDYIKTYKWTDDQKFEPQPDGSTIMTFTSNQDYPILGWLLSHGMYAQPLEPKWLVDEWEKNVRGMMREK